MAKLLKVLGIVVGALIGLFVIALIGVAVMFDPNDYKPEISAAVEDATGRTLTLDGDLELNIFPRLRIALGEAELSDAPGFGAEPFVRIQGARLQVGIMPLILSQSLEIDEARLDGLTLNLARNAQGQGNWESMGQAAAVEDQDELIDDDEAIDPSEGGELTVAVQAIVIEDAEVNWSDATTGETWQLADFNLELEDFGPGIAFPMNTRFSLSGEEIVMSLAAEMQATADLDNNSYLLEDLLVDIDGSGAAWPGGEGALALQFDALEADLDAETVELSGLVLEVLDIVVNGNLSGTQLFSNLSLAGGVEIQDFDPEEIMDLFEVEIETADPDALQRVGASAQLAYDSDRMMLEQMSLRLDDSTLTGSLGMQGETLSFDLAIDEFNADRYLPPAADEPQEEEGSLDEVDLPLDFLRGLDASGRLAIGALRFDGLDFSDLALNVSAGDGRVRLTPSAGLYGGTYAGAIGIDVQDDTALLTLQQELESVDVATLMLDYLELEMFTGTLALDMDVAASGANVGEVMRALDGDVSFALTDGTWEGVDVWQQMRRARATFEQEDAPPAPDGEPRTPFSSISASGVIEDAVLTNDDLTASFEFMTIAGSGVVELLNDSMDLDVTATFNDNELLQSDPLMADLAGDSLPLTVTGSLAAPSVRPDFSAMVRAEVQEAVDERVEEEREELQERLEDRIRGLFDR